MVKLHDDAYDHHIYRIKTPAEIHVEGTYLDCLQLEKDPNSIKLSDNVSMKGCVSLAR
jgi:hypothetical protein